MEDCTAEVTTYTPDAQRQRYGDQTCSHCGHNPAGHHQNGNCLTTDELIARLQVFQRSRQDAQLFDRMASALRMAYLKHHLGDESIGWHELDDLLMTVLCEVMGDTLFQYWLAEQTKGGTALREV